MRIATVLLMIGLGLMSALRAHAAPIRPERRLLAPFLMFGADYRYKGSDRGRFSAAWTNVSEHPLVFARSSDRASMTITPIDNCRYRIETHYSPGSDGSAPAYPDRTEIFDFGAIRAPRLYASSLGNYWIRGRGFYLCPIGPDGRTGPNYCLGVPPDDKEEFLIILNGGADDEDIIRVFRHFFQNVCPARDVQLP